MLKADTSCKTPACRPPASRAGTGRQDTFAKVKVFISNQQQPIERSLIRSFSWALCLVSFLVWMGCGYTTRTTLPKNIKTVHVEPMKNKIDYTTGTGRNIYLPLLEVKSRNAIIDRFLFDGNLKIAKPHLADLILKGELTGYQRSPLRYTDNDDVEEYRVHIIVSFTLTNTKTEDIAWEEPGFVGEATYFVTGPNATSEDSAVEEAILDLARRIVERTIEDW